MIWIAAVASAALVATGVAVAELRQGAGVATVAASFTATTADVGSTLTCGAVQVTNAVYAGRATGDSTLAGPVKIAVRTAIDGSGQLGTVDGFVTAGATSAHLTAVYRAGRLTGLVAGVAGSQRLVGTLTADFNPATGFTSGAIGSGTLGGLALKTTEAGCKKARRS